MSAGAWVPVRRGECDYEALIKPVPYGRCAGRFLSSTERMYLLRWDIRTCDTTRVFRFDISDETWGVCCLPDGSWVVLRQMARRCLDDRPPEGYMLVIDNW